MNVWLASGILCAHCRLPLCVQGWWMVYSSAPLGNPGLTQHGNTWHCYEKGHCPLIKILRHESCHDANCVITCGARVSLKPESCHGANFVIMITHRFQWSVHWYVWGWCLKLTWCYENGVWNKVIVVAVNWSLCLNTICVYFNWMALWSEMPPNERLNWF